MVQTAKDALWLYEKFEDGDYRDVPGFCKIAYTLKDYKNEEDDICIEEKNWSLTPGTYVGVAPIEDDGVDFRERMREIHSELLELQDESNKLMAAISDDLKEIVL